MRDIFETIQEFCEGVKASVEQATEDFKKALPYQVRAQIQAINSLNVTTGKKMSPEMLDRYMSATSVSVSNDGNVVIELDPGDWLVNAHEEGVKPWNMLDTHLANNYKISKRGFRYKVIPLNVKSGGSKDMRQGKFDSGGKWAPGYGDKSKKMRRKLDKALRKSSWTDARSPAIPMSNTQRTSRLVTDDPELKGLYKMERWGQAGAMATGAKPQSTRYVLFRTMTDDPKGGIGKWQHPGIEARDIFPKLEAWLNSGGEVLLEAILENAFSKIMDLDDEGGA